MESLGIRKKNCRKERKHSFQKAERLKFPKKIEVGILVEEFLASDYEILSEL